MKRVLLVDDDSLARNYFKTLLGEAGYEVVEAADGKEAVRLYRERKPDLIVTDIYMPKMSGLDAMPNKTAPRERRIRPGAPSCG